MLLALFVLHTLIMFQGLFETYMVGHHGWNASLRSTIGRNYVEQGFVETGLLPYKEYAPITNLDRAIVHWHHPPGINVLVGMSFAIFGESEAAARIVPVLASLITFFLLYVIVRRRYGPLAAVCTLGIFILLPMQMEFGKMISYEPVVVTAALASLLCLELARDTERDWDKKVRAALIAGVVGFGLFAGFVDWPGFILCGLIGFDALVRKPRQPVIFGLLGVASSLYLAWMFYWLAESAPKGGFEHLAKGRAGNATFEKLFSRTWDRFRDLYLPFVVWTGGLWVLVEARWRRVDPVVLVFSISTLLYIMAFKQGAIIHNFFVFYILPAFAVAAGVGVARALEAIEPRRVAHVLATFWCVFFVATVYGQCESTHKKSYMLKGKSRGVLLNGRLDTSLIGQYVRENTGPKDEYLVHRSVELSMPLRYYSHRKYRKVTRAPRNPRPNQALFIAHSKKLPMHEQKRLARDYHVTLLANHLIFDLRTKGKPGVSATRVAVKPTTLWHQYWVSTIYPPFELLPWPEHAEKYKKRLTPGGAPKKPAKKTTPGKPGKTGMKPIFGKPTPGIAPKDLKKTPKLKAPTIKKKPVTTPPAKKPASKKPAAPKK